MSAKGEWCYSGGLELGEGVHGEQLCSRNVGRDVVRNAEII